MLVVGGGPAGRALAAETGRLGLRTVLLDQAPDAPWRHTYGSWADELPPGLPPSVVAARALGRAVARREHQLGWAYAVLDVPALRAHLDAGMAAAEVTVRAGRVIGRAGPGAVALAGGGEVRARVVVDAGGGRQPLGSAGGRVPAEQAAYGVLVDADTAAGLLAPGQALFMDWRPDHGEPGPPTFLYAVPLGGGSVLLEETSLARHGIRVAGAADERVLFRLDAPRHRGRTTLGFGAAAPLVNPASGFSLAASLRLAPAVARAVAARLPDGPDQALDAAREVLWPPAARAVHRLRRVGLEAVLRMPPQRVPDFFELFFALPEHRRWAYLAGRDDLRGHLGAMAALFAAADWPLRARLVVPALLPPSPAHL